MRLRCLCVHRNMSVIVPPHPTAPTANNDESAVAFSRMRDDEGAQVSDILLTGCASE